MPTVAFTVDSGTNELLAKLRHIAKSISRVVERAIEVTDPEGIAPPAYNFKRYTLTISQEARRKLGKMAVDQNMSVSGMLSALVQKYIWSMKEELKNAKTQVRAGPVGVTFKEEHYRIIKDYLKTNERSFGYLMSKAIDACHSGEIEVILPEDKYRMSRNGERMPKLNGRITEEQAGKLADILKDRAASNSNLIRALIAAYLDNESMEEW